MGSHTYSLEHWNTIADNVKSANTVMTLTYNEQLTHTNILKTLNDMEILQLMCIAVWQIV